MKETTIDTKAQSNITRTIAKYGRSLIYRTLTGTDSDTEWGTQTITYTNTLGQAVISAVKSKDKWMLMGILQVGDLVGIFPYTQAAKVRDMVTVDNIPYTVVDIDVIQMRGTYVGKRLALKRTAGGDPNKVTVTIIPLTGDITFNGTAYIAGTINTVDVAPGVYAATHAGMFVGYKTDPNVIFDTNTAANNFTVVSAGTITDNVVMLTVANPAYDLTVNINWPGGIATYLVLAGTTQIIGAPAGAHDAHFTGGIKPAWSTTGGIVPNGYLTIPPATNPFNFTIAATCTLTVVEP